MPYRSMTYTIPYHATPYPTIPYHAISRHTVPLEMGHVVERGSSGRQPVGVSRHAMTCHAISSNRPLFSSPMNNGINSRYFFMLRLFQPRVFL